MKTAQDIFWNKMGLSEQRLHDITKDALTKADDGELFLEYKTSQAYSLEDNVIKTASTNVSSGFGMRSVCDQATGYYHSTCMNEEAVTKAGQTIKSVVAGYEGVVSGSSLIVPHNLYIQENPLDQYDLPQKIKFLEHVNAYIRAKDSRVVQASIGLTGSWQVVAIVRLEGIVYDVRPLIRLNVSVVLSKDGKLERGSYGGGGRCDYSKYLSLETGEAFADEALRQADVNLNALPCPAGQMPVVLGAGWPGVLLHEAVGHGLEGDFNRKETSTFSNKIGQKVAAKGVTVIDEGCIPGRRGSLNIDDEGTPTSRTVLIEDGILVGYMQDRMNARLMNQPLSGNGRRESFAHAPMPRMTNTYMTNGHFSHEEIIASLDKGIYAPGFTGGQVDITSGQFVFNASEAYMVENGKILHPVKGATLIGNGPEVMQKITMIGNNMELDSGIGVCGKNGQGVPVGVGQPSMMISSMTVGGTQI